MNRNVPKLRFKGFEDEWKVNKLSELSEVLSGKRIPKGMQLKSYDTGIRYITVSDMGDVYVENKNIKYITKEIESKISKYKVFEGDIIISVAGTLGKINIINHEFSGANLTENCNKITNFKNSYMKYIYYYLSTEIIGSQISLSNTISSQPKLALERIRNFKIQLPSLQEQEKIANFLTKVDNLIEEQDGKISDLEQYKKGMMQKIFSQEIRFKDENGCNYLEWEEKKLGELGETYTGLSGKTKENFGFGDGKYITYMNVFKNIKLDINMIDLVDVGKDEKQNRVLKGDILFTASSETPEEVGMVSVCDKDIENLYLNSFCFGFRFNSSDKINSNFMAYFFRSPKIRRKISILGQGSTRYNISKTELMKMNICIPCLEEQIKIAKFLSNIDSIIEKEKNKLEDLRQWKKGLLQQMFI